MILEVRDLYTAYGLSQVLFGVSLSIGQGEVVSVLGRNGVGKTTTLRSIMGLARPSAGSIRWKGRETVGLAPYEISRLGIGLVPEERRIFADLTVWENLDVARRPAERGEGWTVERVSDLFPALRDLRNRRGGYLSGGEQQMLTIARTLMGNPDLLLLDEPSEGLAPIVVEQLKEQMLRLRGEGIAILLCEQRIQFSLGLSSRAYILEKGRVCYQGTLEELEANEEIGRTYLAV
ncbi:MAG: ABC transporter ATP-binding protein [candidate division NC10 bacterium]|nr:ABC transporter ATP-binding protein [candidate division NC10 bacterium]